MEVLISPFYRFPQRRGARLKVTAVESRAHLASASGLTPRHYDQDAPTCYRGPG